MLEKAQKIIDFFAQYPSWVVATSILLVTLAIILLIVFKPEQARPVEVDEAEGVASTPSNVAGHPTNRLTPEGDQGGQPAAQEATPESESPRSSAPLSSGERLESEGSLHSIAVLTAYDGDELSIPSDATLIRRLWPGSVSQIGQAERADLIEATKRYSVLHIEAAVQDDSIQLSDGPMAALQLGDILSMDLSKTELVVLSACSSFRIGKALEESKIKHSIVALGNLRTDIASTFYKEFYGQWSTGVSVEVAYERASITTSAHYNQDVKELIMLTTYREENR